MCGKCAWPVNGIDPRGAVAMSLRLIFWAYLPLALVAALSELMLQVFAERAVSPLEFDLLAYLPNLLPVTFFFVFGAFGIIVMRSAFSRDKSANRWRRFVAWLKGVPWTEVFVARIFLGFLFLELLQSSFAAYKPYIPQINPFSWDAFFIEFDRALMFGTDPWVVSHAIFATPFATFVIDKLYVIWFIVLIASYFYIMVQPIRDWRRLAVMLTIGLSWILIGGVGATVFSSAGPIFMDLVHNDPVFDPLLERLRMQSEIAAPERGFTVLNAMDLLVRGYVGEPGVAFLGISAFPSMHVCMVALIWVYARSQSRIWGWITFAYMIAILIGSVHLGWHYLVDGLFAIGAVWLLWLACARFARYWMRDVSPDLVGQS